MNELQGAIDLTPLTRPDTIPVELQLTEEEVRALQASPRCPKCGHLGVFHFWHYMSTGVRVLISAIAPNGTIPCAVEELSDD